AFLEQAFHWETRRLIEEVRKAKGEQAANNEPFRWFTEKRVTPDPAYPSPHPGTADLYDANTFTLSDHKCQSEGVRDKLRRHGPPHHYFMQMLLDSAGYMHEGYRVHRICLVSWPRTHSTLDDLYVWEHVITAGDIAAVAELIERTQVREALAAFVVNGSMGFLAGPGDPGGESL